MKDPRFKTLSTLLQIRHKHRTRLGWKDLENERDKGVFPVVIALISFSSASPSSPSTMHSPKDT